ncbi:hypothetical protein OEZ60_07690 [Defluviimonas sp. WL0024]|uniref:Uncharacterized protein n=2 Tax=Albidovulum TaxID=205889 RepID=A0ABT3J406_9RHOB|nr:MULTISPECIES: hypothetical protein [Defluviimonas]MCU9847887.1 hypothetical protein [Defluviimonas sp. WL0024]MCW3782400.1 hypothetical protein [Defluviimonas salinarum]
MKIMAAILHCISRRKAEEPDAFELRLIHMGTEKGEERGDQIARPTVFCRRARRMPRVA